MVSEKERGDGETCRAMEAAEETEREGERRWRGFIASRDFLGHVSVEGWVACGEGEGESHTEGLSTGGISCSHVSFIHLWLSRSYLYVVSCMYACMHVCMYGSPLLSLCYFMHACMYVCVYVSMYVCPMDS